MGAALHENLLLDAAHEVVRKKNCKRECGALLGKCSVLSQEEEENIQKKQDVQKLRIDLKCALAAGWSGYVCQEKEYTCPLFILLKKLQSPPEKTGKHPACRCCCE